MKRAVYVTSLVMLVAVVALVHSTSSDRKDVNQTTLGNKHARRGLAKRSGPRAALPRLGRAADLRRPSLDARPSSLPSLSPYRARQLGVIDALDSVEASNDEKRRIHELESRMRTRVADLAGALEGKHIGEDAWAAELEQLRLTYESQRAEILGAVRAEVLDEVRRENARRVTAELLPLEPIE